MGTRIITSSETLVIPPGTTSVEVLVVGGGGSSGGGASNQSWPNGGGGGQVRYYANYDVIPGSDIDIVVGAGGVPVSAMIGGDGGQSSFGDIISAGGKGAFLLGHGGTSGSGNVGGELDSLNLAGGGGGGDSAVGGDAVNTGIPGSGIPGVGGAGTLKSITGISVEYGRGGDGMWVYVPNQPGANSGGGGAEWGGAAGVVIVGIPETDFTIETLPATEVWAIGATIHGLLHNNTINPWYGYMGFQWGLTSPANGDYINWLYSGNHNTIGHQPIQATISGLLPDRTYYYRAALHVGTPPMNVGNIFGDTLSFGGPVSIFGQGWEYVTAKKAEDDVSKLAVGRYYMDKSGNFVYESAQHRIA
jgi:hypothetical protein